MSKFSDLTIEQKVQLLLSTMVTNQKLNNLTGEQYTEIGGLVTTIFREDNPSEKGLKLSTGSIAPEDVASN